VTFVSRFIRLRLLKGLGGAPSMNDDVPLCFFRFGLLTTLLAATFACSPAPNAELGHTDGPLIGGHPAADTEYPSTVYLGCTAAKVGPRQILLAAHCVHDSDSNGVIDYYKAGSTLAFTVNNDASVSDWLEIPIAETHIFSEWTNACEGGCADVWAFDPPHPPDIAVIVLDEDTPTIPIARVDAKPVAIGDEVVVTGYGCEEGYGGPTADPPRFKLETLDVVDGDALDHENTVIAPELVPDLLESYVITPGPSLDENAAGLCPGDSGGPTYRTTTNEQLVVGVNAYYSFPLGSGVPMTNWHTRVDENAHFPVLSWLEGLGALVKRDGAEPAPRGGTRWPIPGTIQAEDYDEGGEGVGYHDSDPSNLPSGQYRNDGVDIEVTSDEGGGFDVGNAAEGEWLHYSLLAASEGVYEIELRVAAVNATLTLALELDGEDVAGSITIPNTGELQTFQTVKLAGEVIAAGTHELRLLSQTGDVNVNWIRFTLLPASCTDTLHNGAESDVDCGAGCPQQCPTGKTCSTGADCQSLNCVSGVCQAPLPMGGAGGGAGSAGASGSGGSAGATPPIAAGNAGSAGAGGAGPVPAPPKPAAQEDSGCGCRMPSSRAPGSGLLLLLGVLVTAAFRRRLRV